MVGTGKRRLWEGTHKNTHTRGRIYRPYEWTWTWRRIVCVVDPSSPKDKIACILSDLGCPCVCVFTCVYARVTPMRRHRTTGVSRVRGLVSTDRSNALSKDLYPLTQ